MDVGADAFHLNRLQYSKDKESMMVVFQNYPQAIPGISRPGEATLAIAILSSFVITLQYRIEI